MNIQFPIPPGNITQAFIIQVLDIIRKTFISVVSKDQSVSRILLSSPNGTVYEVTVSDAGVVTTAINSGKTRDI
jgi:hypothetical protein